MPREFGHHSRFVSSGPGVASKTCTAASTTPSEQAKITGGNTARVYNFDVARLTDPA